MINRFLLLLLIGLTACSASRTAPKIDLASAQSLSSWSKVESLTKQPLVKFKALVNTRATHKKDVYGFREAVNFKSLGEFQIDLLPLGQAITISRLQTSAGSFEFQDFQNGKNQSGAYQDELLQRFFDLPVNDRRWFRVFNGYLPDDLDVSQVKCQSTTDTEIACRATDFYFHATVDGQLTQIDFFNPDNDRIVASFQLLAYQLGRPNQIILETFSPVLITDFKIKWLN